MSAPSDSIDTPNQDYVEVLDPPFNHPDADIIIRSTTSRVDFPVVKAFLAFVSPLWRGMFAIPTGLGKESRNETKRNRPVVPFQEDEETLEILLRLCYPLASGLHRPEITSVPVAGRVCNAAQRHCIEGVERLVMDQLLPTFLHTQPLSLFAFSWRFEMRDEVEKAAKTTLLTPLSDSTYMEELEWVTAGTYHRLKEYHIRCGEVASALATDLNWLTTDSFIWFCCGECRASRPATSWLLTISNNQPKRIHSRWWMDFSMELFLALKDRPCRSTVESQKQMENGIVQASACSTCRKRAPKDLRTFLEALANEVDEAINTVKLEVLF